MSKRVLGTNKTYFETVRESHKLDIKQYFNTVIFASGRQQITF